MIREERLLKVLRAPHVSEKASTAMEKTNTIVLKVAKDATKAEIKAAVQKLFEVEVEVVNTLVVKGKVKRHGQRIGRRSDWKKAYVTLKEGQNLDFVGGAEGANSAILRLQYLQQVEVSVGIAAFELRHIGHDRPTNLLATEMVHRRVRQDALEQHRPFSCRAVRVALRQTDHAVLHDVQRRLVVAHVIHGAFEGPLLDALEEV